MTDTTHAPGCWDWGAKHYECALREIEKGETRAERMEKALKDIRSLSSINPAMNPNPFALTALLAEIHHIADAALAEPTCKQPLQVAGQRGAEHISSPECWCEPELDYKDQETGVEVLGSQEYAMTVEQAARDFFCWFNRHYPAPSTNQDSEWNRLGVALVNHQEEADRRISYACPVCAASLLQSRRTPGTGA